VKAFYANQFVLSLPPGHRFPMEKYRLLHEALMREQPEVERELAPLATDGQLALVHTPTYIEAINNGTISAPAMREIGFPWSCGLVERARRSVGATIAASRVAMQEGVAVNLAGGTHHAYAAKGSGFCVFNDAAVASRLMQTEWARLSPADQRTLQVAIIDLDVHQGNGTAHIFRQDDSVYTLSVHGKNNFPFRKEASNLDVALPDGCEDAHYLTALTQALETLAHQCKPGLIIYLAGADPLATDRLGRMALTPVGLQARDKLVFDWAFQRRVPLVCCMAGGYSEPISCTVAAQVTTVTEALAAWRRWQNG
jgi:acetoin utilization deacetylase AcuC-like enzyme